MNTLNFAENITRLRKERKITQNTLADFIGVTKASVSKWENGQSMPDILLLPQLASFFGVSVDALLGYEPQLSKEQIRALYQKFADDFANRPFEEVMAETQALTKKYYSCCPFLSQICVLWLNHFMLAESDARKNEILGEIIELCTYILTSCKDLSLCSQAEAIKAMVNLQLGHTDEVIASLEDSCDNTYAEQMTSLLAQAHLMRGDKEKADEILQIDIYFSVTKALSGQVLLLSAQADNPARCKEILKRSDALIDTFKLETLNPNLVLNYQFMAALTLLSLNRESEALARLELYAQAVEILFKQHIRLEGDDYFDKLDDWLEKLDLGGEQVRATKLVAESAQSIFSYPAIQAITDKTRLDEIKKKVEAVCSTH